MPGSSPGHDERKRRSSFRAILFGLGAVGSEGTRGERRVFGPSRRAVAVIACAHRGVSRSSAATACRSRTAADRPFGAPRRGPCAPGRQRRRTLSCHLGPLRRRCRWTARGRGWQRRADRRGRFLRRRQTHRHGHGASRLPRAQAAARRFRRAGRELSGHLKADHGDARAAWPIRSRARSRHRRRIRVPSL
jgi:hypothetical protein